TEVAVAVVAAVLERYPVVEMPDLPGPDPSPAALALAATGEKQFGPLLVCQPAPWLVDERIHAASTNSTSLFPMPSRLRKNALRWLSGIWARMASFDRVAASLASTRAALPFLVSVTSIALRSRWDSARVTMPAFWSR